MKSKPAGAREGELPGQQRTEGILELGVGREDGLRHLPCTNSTLPGFMQHCVTLQYGWVAREASGTIGPAAPVWDLAWLTRYRWWCPCAL